MPTQLICQLRQNVHCALVKYLHAQHTLVISQALLNLSKLLNIGETILSANQGQIKQWQERAPGDTLHRYHLVHEAKPWKEEHPGHFRQSR